MLEGKKVLLGVSGSIAAYKSATLVRLLIKAGAEVKVILTDSAATFITPLTLSTLSKNPVFIDFVKNKAGEWNNHVELGLWADLMIIAPASAHTLAKCSYGVCDNLLVATYLSARCPVVFCPAMDLDMYAHASTQNNLKTLVSFGDEIIDAEDGELASGLSGKGRMAEPEQILTWVSSFLSRELPMKGKNVLITAGPTQEAIDPVRFISNHSSGKMAYAIAEVFQKAGASVNLVSGPVSLEPPKGTKLFPVISANDMFEQTMELCKEQDVLIFAAAVADYKPLKPADQKIKKKDDILNLEMTKNKDIAQEFGNVKSKGQLSIGFALETQNGVSNASKKVKKKNFDFIVLNSLQDKGAGFRYDTNQVTFVSSEGILQEFELKSKLEVAKDILAQVISISK